MPAPKKVTIEIYAVEVERHVYDCYPDPTGGPTVTIKTVDEQIGVLAPRAASGLPEMRVIVGGRANEIPLTAREGELLWALADEGGAV
jgi:hypothetical protein